MSQIMELVFSFDFRVEISMRELRIGVALARGQRALEVHPDLEIAELSLPKPDWPDEMKTSIFASRPR